MSEAIEFVKYLNIDAPSLFNRRLSKDGSGYVNAGSLVSFATNVSEQQKEDVLNSTLLAQLTSDKKFDRNRDTDKWYKNYTDVLENLGWVVEGFNFQLYETSDRFQIKSSVLEILKTVGKNNDELQLACTVMDSLQSDANEPWWAIFNNKSTSPSGQGNFQFVAVSGDQGGQLVIVQCAIYFYFTQTSCRWLWCNFTSSSIKLFQAVQTSTLNESVYGNIRQDVIDKLGDLPKQFIGSIALA